MHSLQKIHFLQNKYKHNSVHYYIKGIVHEERHKKGEWENMQNINKI